MLSEASYGRGYSGTKLEGHSEQFPNSCSKKKELISAIQQLPATQPERENVIVL
jgi:hypothetical protein